MWLDCCLPQSANFFALRILPESARWLLTQGRTEEAKKIILKAARVNGKKVSESLLEKVIKVVLSKTTLNNIYLWIFF